MSKGIDLITHAPVMEDLTDQASRLAQQATQTLNVVSLMRAMQEGYRICCEQNGLEVPKMEDPYEMFFKGNINER